MLSEIIKELDQKVEYLINKNIQYSREIERLRVLLSEANSRAFASDNSDNAVLDELKPLAGRILSKIKTLDGEE